jgi:signal transduction histidine kinase
VILSSQIDAKHSLDLFVAMQYPVVGFIAAASFQAARAFQARRLFVIAAGWSLNLLHLVVVNAPAHFPSITDSAARAASLILTLASSAAFMYGTMEPNPKGVGWWKVVSRELRAWLVLAVLALVLSLPAGRIPLQIWQVLLGALFTVVLSVAALRRLGQYYERLSRQIDPKDPLPAYLVIGCYAYAAVQLLYIPAALLDDFAGATQAWGFGLGFLTKLVMAYGYMRLFVRAAARSERDRTRLDETRSVVNRINHEIGTPLAEAHVLTLTMRTRVARGDRVGEQIASLENALNRITAIMGAARDVIPESHGAGARTEEHPVVPVNGRGHATSHAQVVNANTLVERAVVAVRLTRTEKVHWEMHYAGNCCISVVPPRFAQLLINLLRNALDALPDGKGTVVVQTTNIKRDREPSDAGANSTGSDDAVVIVVRDDGEGVSPDLQEHIFREGYSTRRGPGRGYGLAVVSDLVREFGGSVELISPTVGATEDRPGTEARIVLPRVACKR